MRIEFRWITIAAALVALAVTGTATAGSAQLQKHQNPDQAREVGARWLVEHPIESGGTEEHVLQDPFDYAAEDALIAGWKRSLAAMPDVHFESPPGYTLSYSGPGGRASSGKFETSE